MIKKEIFRPGEIIFNSFDEKNTGQFYASNDLLSEDMLRIKYDNNIFLDVGWYNFLNMFIIHIIKDDDWTAPIEKRLSCDLISLEKNLLEVVNNIKQLILIDF